MDVRERQYEIARTDKGPDTLTTGYLFSCFAVYGWNDDKGVGFLWHLDAHACGLERIAKRLRIAAGGDLNGFKLYMTSGLGLYFRLVATLFVLAGTLAVLGRGTHHWYQWIGGGVLVALVFAYFLLNWLFIRRKVRRVFGQRCRFQHASVGARVTYAKNLFRALRAGRLNLFHAFRWPRTAVTVDAARGPELPVLEVGDAVMSSEERFGSARDSSFSKLPVRVAVARRSRNALAVEKKRT